jgi:hypothetical protein
MTHPFHSHIISILAFQVDFCNMRFLTFIAFLVSMVILLSVVFIPSTDALLFNSGKVHIPGTKSHSGCTKCSILGKKFIFFISEP